MKEIQLTRGKVAFVDDEDFEWLNRYRWYARPHRNTFYAMRHSPRVGGKQKPICMHRELLKVDGLIDHKDGNGLNNQKENLRGATNGQNQMNSRKRNGTSSRFKGVCWVMSHKRWSARVTILGKTQHLGYFVNEIEAARAYNTAAIKYFGEFAAPNFIS